MRRLIAIIMMVSVICLSSWIVPSGGASANHISKCTAHKVAKKNYWTCITPGAWCRASAHKKYGYAKKTHKKYRCSYYSSDHRWHWKRV